MNTAAKTLHVLVLLAFVCGFPVRADAAQFQFQPKISATVSMRMNQDVRATYEALAETAGFSVVFASGFQVGTPIEVSFQNVDVREALNLLSQQTKTFWVVWDSKTILVAEDTQTNRRDLDRQILKTIYLSSNMTPQGLNAVVNVLRTTHNFRGIFQNEAANAIVVRDTPNRIALAERTIAEMEKPSTPVSRSTPVASDVTGTFLAQGQSSYRTAPSTRAQLKIKATAPVAMKMADQTRVIYEKLAEAAGLNVIFDSAFRSTPTDFRVDNVDVIDALDLLSIQTRKFWQPLDEKTILVMEDTQTSRRDFERQGLKTIYLSNVKTAQGLNGIVNALRTVLTLRGLYPNEAANAIVIKDIPNNIALAERVVADLDVSAGTSFKTTQNPRTSVDVGQSKGIYLAEANSSVRNATWLREQLKIKTIAPISINTTEESRVLYEKLAEMAGLNIIFAGQFRSSPATLQLNNVDVLDALDLLSLQNRKILQPLDERTIFVMNDTQTNRRDHERRVVKTIYLPGSTTIQGLNGVINVLRTVLTLRGVFQNESANAIVIKGTPTEFTLAERIIADLTLPAGQIPRSSSDAALVTGSILTESGYRMGSSKIARSQLQSSATGPVSIRVNQTPRVIYETLGAMAGVKVTFDPRFEPNATATPFRLDDVNVLDALDLLSLQTGNFWHVVDSKTILVAPDIEGIRVQIEPEVQKTIQLTNVTTASGGNGILNVLRTLLALRQVELNAMNGIVIRDNPRNIALAEKIVADLDIVP